LSAPFICADLNPFPLVVPLRLCPDALGAPGSGRRPSPRGARRAQPRAR
jgi:hypothetical protein